MQIIKMKMGYGVILLTHFYLFDSFLNNTQSATREVVSKVLEVSRTRQKYNIYRFSYHIATRMVNISLLFSGIISFIVIVHLFVQFI